MAIFNSSNYPDFRTISSPPTNGLSQGPAPGATSGTAGGGATRITHGMNGSKCRDDAKAGYHS